MDPITEKLKSTAEIISVIENDLFSHLNVGAFTELDLSDNKLPVSQINKIIVMLENSNTQNKIATNGIATISLQNPLAPPSQAASLQAVLSSLKSKWTITHD